MLKYFCLRGLIIELFLIESHNFLCGLIINQRLFFFIYNLILINFNIAKKSFFICLKPINLRSYKLIITNLNYLKLLKLKKNGKR